MNHTLYITNYMYWLHFAETEMETQNGDLPYVTMLVTKQSFQPKSSFSYMAASSMENGHFCSPFHHDEETKTEC